jgi:hypothetical protein
VAFSSGYLRWRRNLLIASIAGFLALALFVLGSYAAYDSGWWGLDWDDFGDADEPTEILAFSLLIFGPLAALLGFGMGLVGLTARRLQHR